jgi:hypothetical protein
MTSTDLIVRRVTHCPGGKVPAGALASICAVCGAPVVFDPGAAADRRLICMQCAVQPLADKGATMEYVIWSVEHHAWWRPGRTGTCVNLLDAGRFPKDDAERIVHRANVAGLHEVAIPTWAFEAPEAPPSLGQP